MIPQEVAINFSFTHFIRCTGRYIYGESKLHCVPPVWPKVLACRRPAYPLYLDIHGIYPVLMAAILEFVTSVLARPVDDWMRIAARVTPERHFAVHFNASPRRTRLGFDLWICIDSQTKHADIDLQAGPSEKKPCVFFTMTLKVANKFSSALKSSLSDKCLTTPLKSIHLHLKCTSTLPCN